MVILTDRAGQLGNQIVRFAHFIAFAERSGVPVAHAHFRPYADYFPAFANDPLCRYPSAEDVRPGRARASALIARALGYVAPARRSSKIAIVRLKGPNEFDLEADSFVELARHVKYVFVKGFLFRNYEGFAAEANRLRKIFTPREDRLDRARATVAAAKGDADRVVGVHIRRGDYAEWNGGRYFWSDQEYAQLMTAAAAEWPGQTIRFLVCSNESWDPATLHDSGPGPGHEIEDMYALAQCDAILGPPSTFSAWASFWGRVPLWSVTEPTARPSFGVAWE